MTFSSMNRKSRNILAACGASTLGNLSNNKFLKDYYKLMKPYLHDDFADEFSPIPSLVDLQDLARKEFFNYYGTFPTCAVFAPGCLTMAGNGTNLVESKSLSMAVQLVTLIVGKRNHSSKWCHVKTLTDEIAEEKSYEFYLTDENLVVSMEEASWIRYLKATIQCFQAKQGLAFLDHSNGVRYSLKDDDRNGKSVPVKRGLGSSSALVVALYTFLEAITNMHTGNVLEKTLACHMAEKLAVEPRDLLRVADALTSIVGNEDKILSFDARSLNVDAYEWNPLDVELILIECTNPDFEESPIPRSDATHRKEISTILNTMSRWRTHPDGTLPMERMFPRETISTTNSIINEDERTSHMIDAIKAERWDKLGIAGSCETKKTDKLVTLLYNFSNECLMHIIGKLLWKNYHSACKYTSSLPADVERIMTMLETTEGILGANVINRGHGASIIALVQRSRFRNCIPLLRRMKVSQQRYYRIKSFTGASTLYSYERRVLPQNGTKHRRYRPKFLTKYYLRDEDNFELNEYNNFKPTKAIFLFNPHRSLFD